MKRIKLSHRRIVMMLTMFITLMGAIMFFPFNLNNDYTCLYHRIFSKGTHLSIKTSHAEMKDLDNIISKNSEKSSTDITLDDSHNELIQYYIGHYAFFWWTSIALFAISIVLLKKLYVRKYEEQL